MEDGWNRLRCAFIGEKNRDVSMILKDGSTAGVS